MWPVSTYQAITAPLAPSLASKITLTTDEGRGAVLASPLSVPAHVKQRYGDEIVVRVRWNETDDETRADRLKETTESLFLDVWGEGREGQRGRWSDLRIARDVIPHFLSLLPESLREGYSIRIHDLPLAVYDSLPSSGPNPGQSAAPPSLTSSTNLPVDLNQPSQSAEEKHNAPATAQNLFFKDYQPLSVIHPWMSLLSSIFSTHVRLLTIGHSAQGRPIKAFRIGQHPTNRDSAHSSSQTGPRKTVVVIGGQHAREWITVSSASWVAWWLATEFGRSREVKEMLKEMDFLIVPVMNPDGYEYTWETKGDRLWKKNRGRENEGNGVCRGVDLDRNWGWEWNETMADLLSSNSIIPSAQDATAAAAVNPCSEDYPGPHAFSAPETFSLHNWTLSHSTQTTTGLDAADPDAISLVAFLDLHAYSQRILYPFSTSCSLQPRNVENLIEVGYDIAHAMHNAGSGDGGMQNWDVASACEDTVSFSSSSLSAAASGAAAAYAPGHSAIDHFFSSPLFPDLEFAYQIKLRDHGAYGFLLPRDFIA
ncbi:putative metallocarboxypeptidase ecm14, partial [Ascosphaera pollenicola]